MFIITAILLGYLSKSHAVSVKCMNQKSSILRWGRERDGNNETGRSTKKNLLSNSDNHDGRVIKLILMILWRGREQEAG